MAGVAVPGVGVVVPGGPVVMPVPVVPVAAAATGTLQGEAHDDVPHRAEEGRQQSERVGREGEDLAGEEDEELADGERSVPVETGRGGEQRGGRRRGPARDRGPGTGVEGGGLEAARGRVRVGAGQDEVPASEEGHVQPAERVHGRGEHFCREAQDLLRQGRGEERLARVFTEIGGAPADRLGRGGAGPGRPRGRPAFRDERCPGGGVDASRKVQEAFRSGAGRARGRRPRRRAGWLDGQGGGEEREGEPCQYGECADPAVGATGRVGPVRRPGSARVAPGGKSLANPVE